MENFVVCRWVPSKKKPTNSVCSNYTEELSQNSIWPCMGSNTDTRTSVSVYRVAVDAGTIKPLEYLWLWYVTVNIKLEALWRIKMIERILKWVNQQKQDDYRMPIFYDTAAFCFKPFLQIVMQYPCFNHGMNIIYSPLAF